MLMFNCLERSMFLILALGFCAALLYLFSTKHYNYWQKRGVPHVKPWPVVGNMECNILGIKPFCHIIQKLYEQFPNDRYCGLHEYTKPTIMLRDPDLIKQIFVTDCNCFPERAPMLSEDADPFTNKNLFFLKGKIWHDLRATLALAFSTDKMKSAFDHITVIMEKFVKYHTKEGTTNIVDMKDAFTRLANDIAVEFALGIKCDSFYERNNAMYKIGKAFMETSPFEFLKYLGCALSPMLVKVFKITFYDSKAQHVLKKLIENQIKTTMDHGSTHSSVLELLTEAKFGSLRNDQSTSDLKNTKASRLDITDDELIAQVVLFYSASMDAPESLWSLLVYELALNTEIQTKLRTEIDKAVEDCDGDITYEALLGMKYLEMVILETLRLWPIALLTDRKSIKPYTIHPKNSGEKVVHLNSDTYVWLPTFALHRDPKYFPNPEKFDPERFSDENKIYIQPYTYLPFGVGPRSCIAYRYVLLQCKILLLHITLNFEIVPVQETQIPFKINKATYILSSTVGPILGLKPRNKII